MTKGPVPKRSDQRVRRNKDETPVESVTAIGPVEAPELGFDYPHPMIEDFYESVKRSAQARYYEPSDWQYLRIQLHFLNQLVRSAKPSSVMLSTLNTALSNLLVTEGDRRRVRMEVEREQAAGEVVNVAELFRERMEQAKNG